MKNIATYDDIAETLEVMANENETTITEVLNELLSDNTKYTDAYQRIKRMERMKQAKLDYLQQIESVMGKLHNIANELNDLLNYVYDGDDGYVEWAEWAEWIDCECFEIEYPFENSLEEATSEIANWCDETIDTIKAKINEME